MQITPALYTKGIFSFSDDLTTVDSTLVYECVAIRSFAEADVQGMDVFAEVYAELGLTETDYQTDLKAGINVVGLLAPSGSVLYVPDSKIKSYPKMSDSIPRRYILSVDLGVTTSDWDSTDLQQQVSNLVSNVAGGQPTTAIHSMPMTGRTSPEDVDAVNNARDISVKTRTSDHARIIELEEQNKIYVEKIKALQQMLKDQS